MNKFKKLAITSASVVMAGVLIVPMAACGGGEDTPPPVDGTTTITDGGLPSYNIPTSDGYIEKSSAFRFCALAANTLSYIPSSGADIVNWVNEKSMTAYQTKMNTAWANLYQFYKGATSGTGTASQTKLSVADSYPSSTELRLNVGDGSSTARNISYGASNQISGSVYMLDGYSYGAGSVKPVWRAFAEEIGVTFKDVATRLTSDNQIDSNLTTLSSFDILTGSSEKINQNPDKFLDLNLYLDYMPNYKDFLDKHPIVKLSVTADVNNGAMYFAPYFDGNDDIEKYELINYNWVKDLLDRGALTSTTTFAQQAAAKNSQHSAGNGYTDKLTITGTQAVAQAYMGKTDWDIPATNPSDVTRTKTVYIKYSKALEAVKDESTNLGAAYKDIVGSAYTGESGNIMDIMNAAINAKSGAVTGAQLVKLLREYIDVTYCADEAGTQKAYATRSDVFLGEDATWDVDLLTALSRCLVTNHSILTTDPDADKNDSSGIATVNNLYAISGRQNNTQRNSDLYGLAGELYGVRGMTSRYQFAYVSGKSDGAMLDARTSAKTYDAMESMHNLVAEGLLYLHDNMNGTPSSYTKGKAQTMMMYDYLQTQTRYGFTQTDTDKYNFAPILTPVALWDTDGDNANDTRMRFTESWRSVKNTGFCVPLESVQNDPAKLKAVLTFIDYLYSNDGQILATFGPKATNNNNATDGFWYANEAVGVDINSIAYKPAGSDQYTIDPNNKDALSKYFIYKNKVYTGTDYNGTQVPTLTDNLLKFFRGESVQTIRGEIKISQFQSEINSVATNYTDFARGFLGAALPIGNKNQGFEYQCTSACGLAGGAKVGHAIDNGVIQHVTLDIADNIPDLWYTCVPSMLPFNSADMTTIKNDYGTLTNNIFSNSSETYRNLLLDIIYYGYGYNK